MPPQVRSQNFYGWSEWSPSLTAESLAIAPTMPFAPSVLNRSRTYLYFSWLPAETHGYNLTGYEVQVRPRGCRPALA